MAIHCLADLGILEFRVWVRNKCLQHVLDRLEIEHPGGMSYRQLRESCCEMTDLIDQLIADPSSIVSHEFI